jgi:hypothetical protein
MLKFANKMAHNWCQLAIKQQRSMLEEIIHITRIFFIVILLINRHIGT